MVKPSRRGPMVERLVGSYLVSERRACRVLRLARATYRYRSCLDPRTELRMRIREIAQARVRYGYRKIRVLLNREGWDVGKYLVYRLYKEEGLTLKRMKPAGKRKASRQREEKLKVAAPDQVAGEKEPRMFSARAAVDAQISRAIYEMGLAASIFPLICIGAGFLRWRRTK